MLFLKYNYTSTVYHKLYETINARFHTANIEYEMLQNNEKVSKQWKLRDIISIYKGKGERTEMLPLLLLSLFQVGKFVLQYK